MSLSLNRSFLWAIIAIVTVNFLIVSLYRYESIRQEKLNYLNQIFYGVVSNVELSDSCSADHFIPSHYMLNAAHFLKHIQPLLEKMQAENSRLPINPRIKFFTANQLKTIIQQYPQFMDGTLFPGSHSHVKKVEFHNTDTLLFLQKFSIPNHCYSCHRVNPDSASFVPRAIGIYIPQNEIIKSSILQFFSGFYIILLLWGVFIALIFYIFHYFSKKQVKLDSIEEILKEKEAQFSVLAQIAPVGILLYQNDKWVYANNEALKISGYRFMELQEMKFIDILYEEDRDKIRNLMDKRLNGDTSKHHYVARIKDRKGIIKTLDINTLVVSYHGYPAILVVALDISEHQKRNEEMKIFSTIVSQSPASIVITDMAGNITYVNPKFEQISGYTAQEAIGKNPRILKSDYLPPDVYENLWRTISSGHEWNGEFCNKRKDGSIFWELASISPIRNEEGEITHYVAVKEDITQMKEYQKLLHENEEKYRILTENLNEPVAMFRDDQLLYSNNQFTRFFNIENIEKQVSIKELIGFTIEDLIQSADTIKTENGTYLIELEQISINGEERNIHLSLIPIIFQKEFSFICTIRDITEESKLLHSLQDALNQKSSLDGVIPICASCKKIRETDDLAPERKWISPEIYISKRLPAVHFSHSICPECMDKLYPEIYQKIKNKKNQSSGDES